jgi:MoaA/NifB/PqqE/SkfB family radical SAM enzyme
VQRANCAHLVATVEAARGIGLDSVSFLASDVHSEAFNRQFASMQSLNQILLSFEDVGVLSGQIEDLIGSGECGGFVLESPGKLRKIAHHFRCALGLGESLAPVCNAPWKSAVVEADGSVRPCFFHPPIGRLSNTASLWNVLNGPEAVAFRSTLDVASNSICRRCVCSLNVKDSTA